MGLFEYSDEEKKINKVLKYNQSLLDTSSERVDALMNDKEMDSLRKEADSNIAETEALLRSLGMGDKVDDLKKSPHTESPMPAPGHCPEAQSWDSLVSEAEQHVHGDVVLEDLLSEEEIRSAFAHREEIEQEFANKTSIFNKVDLNFLAIAAALHTAKSLIFPYVAEAFGYGESFDPDDRLIHDDKIIKQEHKEANNEVKKILLDHHEAGYWIKLLTQSPPYDICSGSAALGINMGGKYHRLHTLGHDPVLGWLFGTANILTDIITLNDLQSFRVIRKPTMWITPEAVDLGTLFAESYAVARADYLNLPAALFVQYQHYKSDEFTKIGLPVPVLSSFSEEFASDLYKNQYDALCFSRDIKIIGASFFVSKFIDIIISLVHSLFRDHNESSKLFEVRTRKILLISNSIASTSSIIATCITQNPKQLDIGSLLSTISHLFFDIRFILKIKEEFIQNEIDKELQKSIMETDEIYKEVFSKTF